MDSAERRFTTCVIALLLLAVGPQIAAQAPNDEQREATGSPAAEADEADQQARIALDLPIERRNKIAHQQYGATSLDQQHGNGLRMVTVFANGRHKEGDFFCAELAIIDANDQLLMRIRQRAGVGASTSWKPMRKTG